MNKGDGRDPVRPGDLVTMVYGPIAAMLVELFPTRIRYTSMSLPYHIGNGWFGGLLPTTAFAIVAQTGNMYNGLWYPIIIAAADLRHRHAVRAETRTWTSTPTTEAKGPFDDDSKEHHHVEDRLRQVPGARRVRHHEGGTPARCALASYRQARLRLTRRTTSSITGTWISTPTTVASRAGLEAEQAGWPRPPRVRRSSGAPISAEGRPGCARFRRAGGSARGERR